MVRNVNDSSFNKLIAPTLLSLTLISQAMADESIIFRMADPVYKDRKCESVDEEAASLRQGGHYLRHQGWELKVLKDEPGSELEKSDATFCVKKIARDSESSENALEYEVQGFSFSESKQEPLEKRYLVGGGKNFSQSSDEAGHFSVISSKGFGPQSPRNISNTEGENSQKFLIAPAYKEMNLCDIHIHESAEHQGGEFTTEAGSGENGNNASGFLYNGTDTLTDAEKAPVDAVIGKNGHGSGLQSGDTVEIHYVYTTAQGAPGPTLGSCMTTIKNPQLRVEAVVFVLVNDREADSFVELVKFDMIDDVYQAVNIPVDAVKSVEYAGSTTGPDFNNVNSPYQVTWSVHPTVKKVDILTVAEWFKGNVFEEHHAHGVRNLVKDPDLLSPINSH